MQVVMINLQVPSGKLPFNLLRYDRSVMTSNADDALFALDSLKRLNGSLKNGPDGIGVSPFDCFGILIYRSWENQHFNSSVPFKLTPVVQHFVDFIVMEQFDRTDGSRLYRLSVRLVFENTARKDIY
jgi:hypothetical protein